jgi:hypothetical protein
MKHEDEAAIEKLREDERNAVEMWEDILRSTNIGGQMVYNPELLHELAEHTNVPLVIADERLRVWVTNLPEEITSNPALLRQEIMLMSKNNKPISVEYGVMRRTVVTIYYGMTDYANLVSSKHSRALALFPYMQTVRFLADYINGDTYYKIQYPEHNLVRSKAQFKLLQSVEAHQAEMQAFIAEVLK